MADAPDTIVVQSHRRPDATPWLSRCVTSVAQWAAGHGYAYRFFGDELFDLLPASYRIRAAHLPQVLADLGRLLVVRDLLVAGSQRAVWVDADVLVFAPERFVLPREHPFYVCHERWLEPGPDGLGASDRVNNCVLVAEAGNSFVPFYIDAAQQLVAATAGALSPLVVGTQFLTTLDRALPLPKLETVGLFSPYVLRDLADGGGLVLDAYRASLRQPLGAANLCGSFAGQTLRPAGQPTWVVDDALFTRAIDRLCAARGLG